MPEFLTLPLISALAAIPLAALLGALLIRVGPRDAPDGDRKDQAKAMPTSGGIAVFFTVVPLTVLVLLLNPEWRNIPVFVLLAGALYMFVMGVWDDLVALPALPKLVAQLILALAVAWLGVRVGYFDLARHSWETGLVLGVIGSAAWLIVTTNAVNFMDGSDGLAMGSSAVIATALAFLSAVTGEYDILACSLILLGGLFGLLFWNGRGKLFAGDAGALFVGFYLAGLVLIWVDRTHSSVWIAPSLFIAFLADVLLTLIWRFQRKRNLMQPHREHVYQIMLKARVSQPLTAWIYVWVSVHGALIAGLSLVFPVGGALVGFSLLLAILYVINRKIRASALENGYLDQDNQ